MPKKKMMVEWEDGAELSHSQKRPGAYSPLTRDGENNLGQVTLSDVDEDEEDSLGDFDTSDGDEDASDQRAREDSVVAEIVSLVVNHLIDVAVEEAKPHVKRWWNDQVRPAIKSTKDSTRDKFTRIRKAGPPTRDTEAVTIVDASTEDPPFDLVPAPEVERLRMSSDEAHQRLLAALVARAFSDEQIRILLNAQIEDTDAYLGSLTSIQQFSPAELEGRVELILEANPSFLEDFVHRYLAQRTTDESRPLSEGAESQGEGDRD